MTGIDEQALAAWLIERFGGDGEQAGLIDEDLVVGYVEDRLAPEERAAVEGLLARDPEARALLGLVPPPTPFERTARRRWVLPVAAAAALVLAIGAALWAGRDTTTPLPVDGDARLLVLAERLASSDPASFAGLRARIASPSPLDLPATARGGVRVRMPRGVLLDGVPDAAWAPVAGATRYDVTVTTVDGTVVLEGTATEPRYAVGSSLASGDYVLEVRATTPFGEARGSSTFRCADEDLQEEHARAVATIEATAPPEDRLLLRAWHAIAQERFAEALAALERLRVSRPDDDRRAALETVLGALTP